VFINILPRVEDGLRREDLKFEDSCVTAYSQMSSLEVLMRNVAAD